MFTLMLGICTFWPYSRCSYSLVWLYRFVDSMIILHIAHWFILYLSNANLSCNALTGSLIIRFLKMYHSRLILFHINIRIIEIISIIMKRFIWLNKIIFLVMIWMHQSILVLGLSFYFVSAAPKFENLFSNFLISMIWTIFLDIMDSLLIKYDMMILFSGFLSGFRIFPDFFRIFPDFIKSSDFFTKWIIYFSNII